MRSSVPSAFGSLACGLAMTVLLFVVLVAANAKESPGVADLTVQQSGSELAVSFRLDQGFSEETAARVQSGLPTTIVYRIVLERSRRWWWNPTLESGELQLVAMYNALTREYLVNTKWQGRLIESQVVKSLDALRQSMTLVQAIPFAQLGTEPPSDKLTVRVRAELGSKTFLGLFPTSIHTGWTETRTFHRLEPAAQATD